MSDDISPAATPERTVYRVDRQRKRALLKHLTSTNAWSRIMIYARTKYAVARLGKQLQQDGFEIALVHNSMGKARRNDAMQAFITGSVNILVSSDMATRGMALPASIDCIINFDLPTEPCLVQRELNIALAENKLFLLDQDEETALHESPLFSSADYRFTEVAGFEPDPKAQQNAEPKSTENIDDKTAPRRVRRGHAAKKNTGRQGLGRSSRHVKTEAKPALHGNRTPLDEHGDVNGNTLVSDNANRSAIELACDGTGLSKKRGGGHAKSKGRRGNNGSRRSKRQSPGIMGG